MLFLHHRSLLTLLTSLHLAAARIIAIHATDDGFSIVNGGSDAVAGDILEFHFLSQNHSVVMGDPSAPCHPVASGGFFSGFLPTTLGENGDVFHVLINDTSPLFFYCAQTTPANACAAGMVGAINAPADALEKYKCDAAAATTAVIPAPTPYGGAVVPLNPGTVSYTGTATAAATATPIAGGPGGAGGGGTETGECTTGAGMGTATVPAATEATPSTSAYSPGAGGGAGGTATTGATPPASGTGTATGTGTGDAGTGSGTETPGAGDPGATGSDVPTTNGAGRVALWSEGMGVVFAGVMVFGWML